ncbi:MAG: chloride channel protein [Chitinophagales bacterium]|nr:chloride channel protein [Chitinophagales bacterium]
MSIWEKLTFHERIINWLHRKLNRHEFLILSSILVGLSGGLAAVVLKSAVHYVHQALTKDYHLGIQPYAHLIFPSIGLLLCVWYVRRFLNGKLGRGVANVLYSIARRAGFLPRDQMYSHIITSALTVGFGGSAGLEAPIVVTGAAIGSNYSKTYHIGYRDRTLLLACGAASGIAAAFNAPVAGLLFALEVLLADVAISAFIPLIISAAVGALTAKILLGEGILLTFKHIEPFAYENVLFYLLMGLVAGFISVLYSNLYLYVEGIFHQTPKNQYRKALGAGVALAGLIFLMPSLMGEGYESIKFLADNRPAAIFKDSLFAPFLQHQQLVLLLVIITMLVKAIAVAITIGGGGNGGNFAPSLFVGAYLGFAFSSLINLSGIAHLPITNFTLVAMAGILSGIMHAPLTAVFLIAEITGGYELMIPLMIVSAISTVVVRYFNPHSMDTRQLIKKGHMLTEDKDQNILLLLKTSKAIETGFQPVSMNATLGQLVDIVAHSQRNIFPVLDEQENLKGIILLDTIREVMFKPEMYHKAVAQFMQQPPDLLQVNENMRSVMMKFDKTGAWNLPVVDEGRYIGFISKSSLLNTYRKYLQGFVDEEEIVG